MLNRRILLVCVLAIAALISGCSTADKKKSRQLSREFTEIGWTQLREAKYPDAIETFTTALQHEEENASAHTGIGMAYHFKNHNDKALRHLERALAIEPKNSEIKNNLGYVLTRTGQHDRALKLFDEAAADILNRQAYKAVKNKGDVYFEKKEYPKAIRFYDEAIRTTETLPDKRFPFCEAYFMKGRALNEMGNLKAGIASLEKAAGGFCAGYSPEAHFVLGQTYMRAKDKPKARGKFRDIIDRYPNTEWAKKSVEMLLYVE